jgi:hypothetical protein
MAEAHAWLASLAGAQSSGLNPGDGLAEADRAIDCLRRAIAAGYRISGSTNTHPAFESIRSRLDFQALMLDVAFPEHAFGPFP